ncbi:MAG: 16S rRNA processing protein RimM [Candidatus Aminicenantes bacterium]|nr:16S rRNA processing protein RimM [Candidatus Aminicenantes bacterium]
MLSTLKSLFFLRIFLERKGVREGFQVESFRPYKEFYILKLKGIDSLPKARELAGQEILLPEEDLRTLEKGKYYFFQIIGCSVVKKNGEKIGSVKDLLCIKDNDLLVVAKGKREILVPFTKSICLKVNLKRKEILVDLPEGLSELDEI